MPGLVHSADGDDSLFYVVDDALWDQIVTFWESGNDSHLDFMVEVVFWWLLPDLADRPDNAPDRNGSVLVSLSTQTYCLEQQSLPHIRGILHLPG